MDLVKNMTAKRKFKKSGKDKQRNLNATPQLDQPIHSISGPMTIKGGDGLYAKLTQHQRNISTHIRIMFTVLESGQEASPKLNITTTVTQLLEQVNCAVTTSHQCLTKDLFDRNDGLKQKLDDNEKMMFLNLATMVKWADFDLKIRHSTSDDGHVLCGTIRNFESALNEIVRLVDESQSSVSFGRPNMTQSLDFNSIFSPTGGEGMMSPQFAAVMQQSRKTSWSPSSSSTGVVAGLGLMINMQRATSVKPSSGLLTRDSMTSTHSESSSDSDEKRRSGSSEHYSHNSPEHTPSIDPAILHYERQRSQTTPLDMGQLHSPPVTTCLLPSSPPQQPLDPRGAAVPPPLPRKGTHYNTPIPRAMNHSVHMNGRHSDDFTEQQPEKPPPLPVKKKKQVQMNGHSSSSADGEELPPPVPIKHKKAPPTTATPTSPVESSSGSTLEAPPLPLRFQSIPGVKNALETPPPKPPRTDRPTASSQPPAAGRLSDDATSTLNRVKQYNEEVMKTRGQQDPEKAPPIPLKKKTVMKYWELIGSNYTFDDSLTQPLYIPAIPPKKRRRPQPNHQGSALDGTSDESKALHGRQGSAISSDFSASTDDLYKTDDDLDDKEVNYLECEEVSGYLKFNKEEDGGYTLRGGPVDALIAYAGSTTNAVKHYTEAFLLTYYTFIEPEDLISKMLLRLSHFYKQMNSAIWTSTTSLLVRVLNGLNQPLVEETEVKLINMVHQMLTDGNLKFAQILRNALVMKLNQLIPDQTKEIPLGKALSSPNPRKLSIMEYTPDELARQMTVLDNDLFQKVDVSGMLYWAKEQNEEKSPHLTAFTMHFNKVSQWTKTKLLDKTLDMRGRVKLILHFVSTMKCLRETYNNFNSYLSILSAIESSPVSRLDWPDRVTKVLEEPRLLIDNKGSFKNYREAFARAKPPCIPYIGLYLQDLTFIEMQPSKLEDGTSINFTKRWKQFKSVDHIRFAQTKQYTALPDPEVLSLFDNFEHSLSDEELWQTSNEIKPRQRTTQ